MNDRLSLSFLIGHILLGVVVLSLIFQVHGLRRQIEDLQVQQAILESPPGVYSPVDNRTTR